MSRWINPDVARRNEDLQRMPVAATLILPRDWLGRSRKIPCLIVGESQRFMRVRVETAHASVLSESQRADLRKRGWIGVLRKRVEVPQ